MLEYISVEGYDLTLFVLNRRGYAEKEGDARQFHPKLRPPVNPEELEIDEQTGMKVNISIPHDLISSPFIFNRNIWQQTEDPGTLQPLILGVRSKRVLIMDDVLVVKRVRTFGKHIG